MHRSSHHVVAVLVAVTGTFVARVDAQSLVFAPCTAISAFECANLAVPLVRPDTGAGTLTLAVARHVGAPPSAPVLLALTGGPGQSGLPFAGTFASVFASVLDRVQLVVLDQRGTGAGALLCPELEAGGDDPVSQCAMGLGASATHFTTADSVADLDALRQALGVERWAVAGVSYGTLVALQYARRYPEHVDALLLDSTLSPGGPSPFLVESFLAAGRVIGALCPNDGCRAFTTDPVADTAAVVGRLASPLAGTIVGPDGRRASVRLASASVLFAILEWTDLHSAMRALFPAAMAAARAGDDVPLLRLVWLYARALQGSGSTAAEFSSGLNLATTCTDIRFPWLASDAIAVRLQARAAALAALVGDFRPFDRHTIDGIGPSLGCLHWPVTSVPGALSDAPPPDVRTLILGGEVDVRTPVENASAVASLIHSAIAVTVPNVGHSVLTSASCARSIAAGFLSGVPAILACEAQEPTYAVRPVPHRLSELPRPGGLVGRVGTVAALIDATLRDAIAVSAAAAPRGGAIQVGGLRGGRLMAQLDPQQRVLTLRRYALLARARVSGTVTLDENGTVGTLRTRGRTHGRVRYEGHHAIVSGRSRDGEAAPAAVLGDLGPGFSEEALPPIP